MSHPSFSMNIDYLSELELTVSVSSSFYKNDAYIYVKCYLLQYTGYNIDHKNVTNHRIYRFLSCLIYGLFNRRNVIIKKIDLKQI